MQSMNATEYKLRHLHVIYGNLTIRHNYVRPQYWVCETEPFRFTSTQMCGYGDSVAAAINDLYHLATTDDG